MEYDTRAKRYVAAEHFVLLLSRAGPYVYLAQLRSVARASYPGDSWILGSSPAPMALTPRRDIDITVLRRFLDATGGVSVDVFYQSMNKVRAGPIWRIAPHLRL